MAYQAAVITVSDACSAGTRADTSGPAVCAMLREAGYEVVYTATVPDERGLIASELRQCADGLRCDLVVSTGGTGLSPRDVTPEATRDVLEREIPAIPQAMLFESLKITPRAMLSRAAAPICASFSASASALRITRARSSPSFSHSRPFSPSRMISAAVLPRASTAGVPIAAASRTTMGALSYRDGNTNRLARENSASKSFVSVIWPTMRVFS